MKRVNAQAFIGINMVSGLRALGDYVLGILGGVTGTPHPCPPSARVQQASRKWEEKAAPPLSRKIAGKEGMALREDHFLFGILIKKGIFSA